MIEMVEEVTGKPCPCLEGKPCILTTRLEPEPAEVERAG
jgi:hypothetical protein